MSTFASRYSGERTIAAYNPSDTLFTNTCPFTSARSRRRSTASPYASRAPTTSSRSSPRSSAKWFLVPAGTTTIGSPNSAATVATIACDPSPPAIPRTSTPLSAASRTLCNQSCPGSSTCGSIPRRWHSSTRWNRSAFPPPDLRFMNRTPRCAGGTGVPGTSAALSERRVVPSAYLARPTATTRATIRSARERPVNPSSMTIVTPIAITATSATTAPTMRATPERVAAVHSPASAATRSASSTRTRPASDTAVTAVTTVTAATKATAAIAATRLFADGLPTSLMSPHRIVTRLTAHGKGLMRKALGPASGPLRASRGLRRPLTGHHRRPRGLIR